MFDKRVLLILAVLAALWGPRFYRAIDFASGEPVAELTEDVCRQQAQVWQPEGIAILRIDDFGRSTAAGKVGRQGSDVFFITGLDQRAATITLDSADGLEFALTSNRNLRTIPAGQSAACIAVVSPGQPGDYVLTLEAQ